MPGKYINASISEQTVMGSTRDTVADEKILKEKSKNIYFYWSVASVLSRKSFYSFVFSHTDVSGDVTVSPLL